MATFDPADPLKLKDEIVAKGAAMYYAEQADLQAQALWDETHGSAGAVEQARAAADAKINAFKQQFRPRRLPKTVIKQTYKILNKRTNGKLSQIRHGNIPVVGRLVHRRPRAAIPLFSDIAFTLPDKPVVSVVIPVYNLLDITLDCLRSLAKIKETVPFEVIVVDDASPDPMLLPVLRRIPGIVYIRQTQNGGFVNSCNAGAARARGEFIYFLNNDTTVDSAFLLPIVELYKDPKVGAVGSKLVHPSGKLQEAGGIIFANGDGWNYGKGDNPNKWEYNFVREVDYCSGAGLSIRRALFEQIGGFNLELAPGYYEDVELCFAVRGLGYHVMYQPRSVVVHYEGASSSNVAEGQKPMKAYQLVNYHKFKKLREAELAMQWPKQLEYLPTIARRKRGLRIWIFDYFVPMFDRDYGSARMLAMAKLLAREHTVTFVARDVVDREKYRAALQDVGVEVCPRVLGTNFTNRMRADGKFIDLAIVSRPEVMHYFYHLLKRFAPQAPIIYDTVDVHHMRLLREVETITDPEKKRAVSEQAAYFKQLEQEYGSRADTVWAITPADQEIFKKLLPAQQVDIVSGAHPVLQNVAPVKGRSGLFYIGSFHHPPNRAAVEYYVKEIYPRLRERLPGVPLNILGQPVPDELRQFALERASQDIRFVGAVSDAELLEYHQRSRLFICPLRFGSGLKGKVLMALANGVPVVTTSVGAEGIPAHAGEDIEIADTPEQFVDRIVALYKDDELWETRSRNGQRLVEAHYSESHLLNQMRASIESLEKRMGPFRHDFDPKPIVTKAALV